VRAARSQRDELTLESRRIEAMLRAALVMVERSEASADAEAAPSPPAEPSRAPEPTLAVPPPRLVESDAGGWPQADTSTFEPVDLPPPAEERSPEANLEPGIIRRLASGSSRDFDCGD